ncbi:hypothetical protein [Actinoplanes sp. NPDC051494]|uniref:hypothetical protein n=1 Tax=Actinoplanes sp. NPDC051494 TaxID=3363907 RepID=UPI0037ADD2C6
MTDGYAVDAPKILIGLCLGAVTAVFATLVAFLSGRWLPGTGIAVVAVVLVAAAASYAYATLIGKALLWRREIVLLALRGDETTVDLG